MNGPTVTRSPYRIALFSVSLIIAAVLVVLLRWVLLQLFVSVIIAAGMTPLVSQLTGKHRRFQWAPRPSRAIVVILIYGVAGVIVLLLGAVVVDALAGAKQTLEGLLPQVDERSRTVMSTALTRASDIASALSDFLGGIVTIVLILFIALYFIVDAERMRDYALVFVPRARQDAARRMVSTMVFRLGHWIVAQLAMCLIVGGGAAIGLSLIGVPGAALLGVVWAVAEFLPGIGPFISAIPSILLGFLAGPTVGVAATIFTFAWSQVESNFITPRIMGRALQLSSAVVLISLMVGNELLGLPGALIAIPATAAIAVILDEIHDARTTTSHMVDGADVASARPTVAQ